MAACFRFLEDILLSGGSFLVGRWSGRGSRERNVPSSRRLASQDGSDWGNLYVRVGQGKGRKEEGGVHGGAGLFLFFANALAMIGVSLPYSRVSPSRPRSHTPRFRGRLDHKALPCLAPKASAGMDAAWPRVG